MGQNMKKVFLVFGLTIVMSAVLIALAISDEVVKDPVCGMEVNPADTQWKVEGKGGTVYFCAEPCLLKFCEEPTAYLSMEKLKELKICVTGICTDCECCPNDTLKAVEGSLDDIPCAGCAGHAEEAADVETEEEEDCTGDCEDCPHGGQTPH